MGADQKPRYNHILDLVKISEELSAQASDGRLQICRRQWLTRRRRGLSNGDLGWNSDTCGSSSKLRPDHIESRTPVKGSLSDEGWLTHEARNSCSFWKPSDMYCDP